ncbi:Zinc metalloprotease [Frankliniella fusca]|uniref:Zinc metalloprotease n=1 Tax=Frankliniella fusca TaxID=407009 RepID=A0AAE1LHQ6_9NEOP|nr:Zinc metalloprotease [Frankliniella fusca]
MEIFEEWFSTILLNWASSVDGVKVVIGDNVSSHFSPRVFEMCAEHNIRFVCLPPNSTHLLQPLDVAFFSPLKTAWRRILNEWKIKSNNRTLTLPKPSFPGLLKTLMEAIEENREKNLQAAFKATGIAPLCRQQALKRVPGAIKSPTKEQVYSQVSTVFLEKLQEQRYGEAGAPRRGRRLQVSPGKSWAVPAAPASAEHSDEETVDNPDAVESEGATPKRSTRPAPNKRPRVQTQSGAEPRVPSPRRRVQKAPVRAPPGPERLEPPVRNGTQASVEPQQGDYILVKRGRTYAVGQVDHIDENHELAVKFLTPLKNITFVWPAQQDMEAMDYSEVVEILEPPKKLKKKGCPLRFSFNFSEFLPLC